MILNEKNLVALGCLKMNVDNGNDYYDFFLPLVLQATFDTGNFKNSIMEINNAFERQFGKGLPSWLITTMIRKLVMKKNLIENSDGSYIISEGIAEPITSEGKATVQRHIYALSEGYITYAKDKHNTTIIKGEASKNLLTYIDNYCIECLQIYVDGTQDTPSNGHITSKTEQIIGNYFLWIYKESPLLYASFEEIICNYVKACIYLYSDVKIDDNDDYSNTQILLDTPSILQLLGFDSPLRQKVMEDIIALLIKLRAKLCIFDHTLDEINTVLKYEADHYREAPESLSVRYWYQAKKKSRSDLYEAKGKVPSSLETYGIKPIDSEILNQYADLNEIRTSINDVYKFPVVNSNAQEYDSKSVAKILSIRSGSDKENVENCKAVLITSNTKLAREVFFYHKNRLGTSGLPSVVSQYYLANLAWLKQPSWHPKLLVEEIIMFTHSVTQIKPENLKKLLAIVKQKLESGDIDSKQAAILRVSSYSHEEAQRLSLGDQDALGTLELTEIVKRHDEEIRSKVEEEESQKNNGAKAQLSQKSLALAETSKELEDTANRLAIRDAGLRESLHETANGYAKTIGLTVGIAVAVLLFVFHFWEFEANLAIYTSAFIKICKVSILIWGLYNDILSLYPRVYSYHYEKKKRQLEIKYAI